MDAVISNPHVQPWAHLASETKTKQNEIKHKQIKTTQANCPNKDLGRKEIQSRDSKGGDGGGVDLGVGPEGPFRQFNWCLQPIRSRMLPKRKDTPW